MALLASALTTHAASLLPLSIEDEVEAGAGVFRGTVVSRQSYRSERDGSIYTATVFRVIEPLKGKFASTVRIIEAGGTVGTEIHNDSLSSQLHVGDEHLIIAGQRADGTLFALRGAASARRLAQRSSSRSRTATRSPENQASLERARRKAAASQSGARDFTEQSAASVAPGMPSVTNSAPTSIAEVTGLMSAIPSRFILPDRGEPIPYIIDAQSYPAGMTQEQAVNAVHKALAAWSAVSSVKFVYEGLANLGVAAPDVTVNDGKIRVQLHDNYNFINSAGVLGRGGHSSSTGNFNNGGYGARVGANEFHRSVRGYLVLEHGLVEMQNLKTFEEVLCHEIGHVLGLAHSSETYPEPNATLREATMYFQVHADGRGATLGSYDPPVVRLVHPLGDTPPYAAERVMDAITAPTAPNLPGVNEVEIRGYDLQTASAALTFGLASQTSANGGAFSLVGNKVKFTPGGYFNGDRADPAGTGYYNRASVRFEDGVNASPHVTVRVISYLPDSAPSPSDGIPDAWMSQYFGSANPAAGANRGAGDDYDGDGRTNFDEYRTGTSPIDSNSVFRATPFTGSTLQWTAKPYEVYEVHSTADFTGWTPLLTPITPTGAAATVTATAALPVDASAKKFYRVERVP